MSKILFSKILFFFACLIATSSNLLASEDEKKISGYVNNRNFSWKVYDTTHFRVYAETDSYAAQNIEHLKSRIETIYTSTLAFVGERNYKKRSFVFLLDSRQRMKDLTGDEGNGLAQPDRQAVFMVYSPSIKAVGNHEFFHLFAWNLWGSSKEVFVSEGMAVYSDDKWHSYNLHPLAKFLKEKGKLVPLKQLLQGFRKENDLVTYPQSGSFMKFLSEKYGKDKIRKIWKGGQRAFAKSYGKSLDELEKEWLAFLDGHDSSKIEYQGW